MRSRLFDNLGLKVISLVLGFSLWYVVAGERGAEFVLEIPLEFRNVPEGHEVIEESVKQVDVRLRGSSEFVRALSPQEIQVVVDLSNADPGENTVYVTPDHVRTPYGVRVMRVTPASVKVSLDRTAERTVRAVPRVVGKPASGFELANIRLQPAEILVNGPASRLEGMEQVTTEPISAEGLRETYSQSVRVLIDDPFVRPIDGNEIEVTLEVEEEKIEKELAGVPISVDPGSVSVKLTPDSIKVLVAGPRSLVEKLRVEEVEAIVRLGSLGPGNHEISPEVALRRPDSETIEILAIVPDKVRARVTRREE